MAQKKKIAVIGAGPAGLTAAYLLSKLNHEVIVFEKDPNMSEAFRVQSRTRDTILTSEVTDFFPNQKKLKIFGQRF
jgi:flavin-dependent dehydrogenase